jgi:hypothetical protein
VSIFFKIAVSYLFGVVDDIRQSFDPQALPDSLTNAYPQRYLGGAVCVVIRYRIIKYPTNFIP